MSKNAFKNNTGHYFARWGLFTSYYDKLDTSNYLGEKFHGILKGYENSAINFALSSNPYATKHEYDKWVFQWKLMYRDITNVQRKLRALRNGRNLAVAGHNNVDELLVDLTHKIAKVARIANILLNARNNYKILASLQKYKEAA